MSPLLLTALLAAAPFPLPAVGGKPLAVRPDQKVFRLPLRFETVRGFYEARFGRGKEKGVALVARERDGRRSLQVSSRRPTDAWTRAVVTEGEAETVVEVTPVLRLDEEAIEGNAKPLVQFVIGRSPEVKAAVDGIDHTESMRAR